MKEEASFNAFNFQHVPVLANEVLESIKKLPPELLKEGLIIDATIGGGGHSELVLKNYPEIKIIGIDQDPDARKAANKYLSKFESRIEIIETNFADYTPPRPVIMVLADLGVSSHQLTKASRGFSFRSNGPIDMRMNPKDGISASDLLDELNEKDLANLIFKYGEERFSRRIARKIKLDISEKGPYLGTIDLAYAISGCYPKKLRHSRIHPATKTFQALRIAVNNELDVLDVLLKNAPDWLVKGGLLGIISFHSLEDRKVKNSFISDKRLERITRKPIQASSCEILQNIRSRSAKFRIASRTNIVN
tara:strand:+ start:10772 stop:11689 length:918 start_codon:yes stop_codon:yes gene_type:complete